MPYDARLVAAFNETLAAGSACRRIAPGKVLYRGGGRIDAEAFPIRLGNVFLSSHPAYARTYAGDWQPYDHRYLYRAVTTREIRVAVVHGMRSVVAVAVEALRLRSAAQATAWQRDALIPLAHQAMRETLDGILFLDKEDPDTDEFLLDNTEAILALQDLHIFHKDRRDPKREAAVLRVESAGSPPTSPASMARRPPA